MLIRDALFAAIDFESAGTAPGGTDAPVQLGLAGMRGLEIAPELSFRSFLHCTQKVTWAARKVHGISPAQLAEAPRLIDLWPRLNATLRGGVVVAHGAGTEKRFLRAFPMHGFGPWVDTVKVSQAAYPDLPDHSLEALAHALHLKEEIDSQCPGLTFHDAFYDAVASLLVLRHIILAANLSTAPVEALVNPQRAAYFLRRAEKRRGHLPH